MGDRGWGGGNGYMIAGIVSNDGNDHRSQTTHQFNLSDHFALYLSFTVMSIIPIWNKLFVSALFLKLRYVALAHQLWNDIHAIHFKYV